MLCMWCASWFYDCGSWLYYLWCIPCGYRLWAPTVHGVSHCGLPCGCPQSWLGLVPECVVCVYLCGGVVHPVATCGHRWAPLCCPWHRWARAVSVFCRCGGINWRRRVRQGNQGQGKQAYRSRTRAPAVQHPQHPHTMPRSGPQAAPQGAIKAWPSLPYVPHAARALRARYAVWPWSNT